MEDLPGFDGAGLYDSYLAKIDKDSNKTCYKDGEDIKPKTVACAIKGML